MSDAKSAAGPPADESFPTARVAEGGWLRGAAGMWILAAVCAIGAVVLVVRTWRAPGPLMTVTFEHGYGIEAGNPVRLRGIDVGQVEAVTTTKDLERVEVRLRLTKEASALAREGTRFWIQRPQVSLAAVRGLDTLVGPHYIGVQPGPVDGAKRRQFVGVETPRQFSDAATLGVTVRFRQGFGLSVAAPVRFRGVQVGEVVDVELDQDLGYVLVHAELDRSAERLTHGGSQFWVERPQVGVAQVRGLDTLLKGPYLAAAPGPVDDEVQYEFEGLDSPPADGDSIGGIEVVLLGSERQGLQAGSPVLYRGVTVGNVVRVGLSSDGTSVESRIYIQSAYRQLVRSNTKFWSNSGLGLDFGIFSGLDFSAESLETIAAGGVGMATPDAAGKPVATGHRFPVAKEADPKWIEWRPPIPIGRALLPEGLPTPVPVRASLRWKRRRFGILRDQQREAWTHPLAGHRLLCPLEGELPAGLTLELEGETISVTDNVQRFGELLVVSGVAAPADDSVWPDSRLRAPDSPENCVLLAGPDSLPVSVGRIRPHEDDDTVWKVDISVELDADWHGASVVAQKDAALIGALLWDDGQARIRVFQPEEAKQLTVSPQVGP